MTRLLLVRHGLPHEGHADRPVDPPLHDDGRHHAARLARALLGEGIDRIVTSPQQRARDTAQPLAEALGIDPEVIAGVAEVDAFSTLPYRSLETLRAHEPRFAEFVASPARFLGRDPVEYRQTVHDAFDALLQQPRGDCIVVFTHGMTIKTLLSIVLGLDTEHNRHFSIGHCSVTRLSGSSLDRMRIDSLNESLGDRAD